MVGLPSDLLKRSRDILSRCDEFDSHEALMTVFVTTELKRYHSRLPSAESKTDRIQKVIEWLLPERLADGRSVFLLFIDELCNRYHEEDKRRSQLAKLCSDISQVLSGENELVIPFITVTMTREEANALIGGAAFSDTAVAPIEQARFQEFIKGLQEDNRGASIDDEEHTEVQELVEKLKKEKIRPLLEHYGDAREDWRPYFQDGDTVKQIVLEMADHINQNRQGYLPIRPCFFSADFFAGDDDIRLQTWDQLSWLGCVLIVDAISLFHPIIYRRLLQAEMGSNQRVAIATVIFSPIISSASLANQLIKQEVRQRMQRAFIRSAWYFDVLCNHEIENMRGFQQWFFAALPEAVRIVYEQRRKKRPHPTGLNRVRSRVKKPGVSGLIFGQGVGG